MNDPEPTKAPKPESPTGRDETVDGIHPSDDQLALFVAGRLVEPRTAEIDSHLESCSECIATIKQLRTGVVGRVDTLLLNQSTADPNETVDHAEPSAVGFDATVSASFPSTFGDYELISEIARGGMGVVYKARQKSLNRIVALKMIKSGEFANQEQVDRFYKEAEATANLDHPGIVPVYEVGEVDGQHYFTMGFVDGDSLADRLRDGPLPPKEAARYAKSIAEAVAFAHSKGVIHRDLKPGNVLITNDGQLRITDFGLAKRVEEDSELTSTGQVLGTPSYMPPEQAEGKLSEIGPPADIYAIGGTLYCMLTGRPPFQAANLIETLHQVLEVEPLSLSSLNRAVPQDLETLCLKCLEKRATSRYLTAQALVDELNRFLNSEPIVARPIGRVERVVRWCKRKPVHAMALVAVVLLAVVGPTLWIQLTLSNRDAAMSKVDTLLNATPSTIPLVLEELDRNASIVDARLRELDREELLPPQRLRVSLALLPLDPTQLGKLKQRLYDCTYDELEALLDRIRDHGSDSIVQELWRAFRANELTENHRFRTGVALAALDPGSEQWIGDDYEFLVNSILEVNTVYQPAVRRSMAPIATKLIDAVKVAYESAEPNTLADESSANALVDFAVANSEILVGLSVLSSPKQHSVVYPVVEGLAGSDESVAEKFAEITTLQPAAGDDELTRIKLGKKRAGAAINLVRLNKPDEALEALRVREDLESLTQFVHGYKARGITVEQLLDLLNRATSVSERYGILLALGEFAVIEIPAGIRSMWVEHIKGLYANDPSSGIHGASGWLLREWGLTVEAKAIEEREVPYSKEREWFTLKVNLAGPMAFSENHGFLTFVVFPAGEYKIGSPDYEADRDGTEEQQRMVTITRPFAVLDREVTRGEIEDVTGFPGFRNEREWQADRLSANAGTDWYRAVDFCRKLSRLHGLLESQQPYADPKSLDREDYPADPESFFVPGAPLNWPLELSNIGFRLPTSAEWEIACRGGSLSRYAFGSDSAHLGRYGWYEDCSDNRGHRPRELRPNYRGLFDMLGNMHEWCHDWSGGYVTEETVDPVGPPAGPPAGSFRVLRGGDFSLNANYCRSARRYNHKPSGAYFNFGFRVALSLGDESNNGP